MPLNRCRPAVFLLLLLALVLGCSDAPSNTGLKLSPAAQQYCDAGQSLPFNATGGSIAWSLTGAGTLSPAAQSSGQSSVLYTAPTTVVATSTATLTATSGSSVATVSIIISPPPTITTVSLPNASTGMAYNAPIVEAGGVAPFTWTLASGALPAGITLDPSSGILSGTPTTNGVSAFTVAVTDLSASQITTSSVPLAIVVGQNLAISAASLPGGEFGIPYSAALNAAGGVAPYSWSLASGALPSGLSLSSAGILSGTPAGSGSFPFTAQASDAGSPRQTVTRQFLLTIAPQLVITTSSLPPVAIDNPYSVTLSASGGTGTDVWSLAPGSTLPAGLSLASTGILAGTPTAPASAIFTVNAADAGVPPQQASRQFTLNVLPALSVATSALPDAARGSSYSSTLLTAGGTAPFAWSLATGSALPAGLSLGAASGILSGAPTTAGDFTFGVSVVDSSKPQQTAAATFKLHITSPAPLQITSASLPNGISGAVYSATLQATGGVAPLTWSVLSGGLPTGISLNSATGALSGKPSGAMSAVFTVQVMDSASPASTASRQFNLNVGGSLGSGADNAELKGSYAFLVQGFRNGNAAGAVYGNATIGSLTADGNGNFTGIADENGPDGVHLQVAVTGQYAIGADHRGTLLLSDGNTLTPYSVASSARSGGIAHMLSMIEFDDSSSTDAATGVARGEAKLQTSSAFTAATMQTGFVYGLTGETSCRSCSTPTIAFGPISAAGLLMGDGAGKLGGQEDVSAYNSTFPAASLTGSYTNPDAASGRGTFALDRAGAAYPAPGSFVYVIVDATELILMSADSHASAMMLSGWAHFQQRSTFSAGSLSGTLVGYGSSAVGGDGATLYPQTLSSVLSLLSVTGSGTATLSQDSNRGGVYAAVSGVPVSFTVAANGRASLTYGGGSGPVVYLYDNNQGTGIDLSQIGGASGIVQFEPQTIASSYPSFLTGSFTLSTLTAPVAATMTSGIELLAPNTGGVNGDAVSEAATLTSDSSTAAGTLTSGQASSFLYLESSSGRMELSGVSGGAPVAIVYAISPAKAVQVSTGIPATSPILVLER